MRLTLRCLAFAVVLTSLNGCQSAPSDLREWRVSDHDHTDDPSPTQVQGGDAGASPIPGINQVVLVAWKERCMRCHGQFGRGDGPQGQMVHARNLADATWQQSVTDAQVAASIRKGKGLMPAQDLPDGTIAGLVRLVRLIGGIAPNRSNPSSAPAGSAPVNDGVQSRKP
jgi:hypothetical protein